MQPAFSVIFLTTLIGAGQGLFLALYAAEAAALARGLPVPGGSGFIVLGSAVSLVLTGLGLVASFLHLGHPERAWRAATQWRTSWLSREVIALPAFLGTVFLYGVAHWLGREETAVMGALATVACIALFVCTAMVYISVRFLQEWSTPLTMVNYVLLGCASGFTLATALAAFAAGELVIPYAMAAATLTLAAMVTRMASLVRNARLKARSSLQTAIGVRHPRIVQKSQGAMGGSYNTREFFHGRTAAFLRSVKWIFLVLAFPVPMLLLAAGLSQASAGLIAAAFVVQYVGLIAERWFFFAQANHPQNLYYQTVS